MDKDQDLEDRIAAELDAGDLNAAIAAAERGYGARIFRFLYVRLLYNTTEAEDCYQEFWLALCKGIAKFQRRCPFRFWAFRVAHRTLNRGRKKARRPSRDHLTLDSRVGNPPPKATWERPTGRAEYLRLLTHLKAEEVEILYFRHEEEMSFAEIAMVLSSSSDSMITEDACAQRYSRTKKKLRELREAGMGEGSVASGQS